LSPIDETALAATLATSHWKVSDSYLDTVAFLIDRWCERRALQPLSYVLLGWPCTGLTDSVMTLRDALDKTRTFARNALSPLEEDAIGQILNAIDGAVAG
jgi:hypothetical protein